MIEASVNFYIVGKAPNEQIWERRRGRDRGVSQRERDKGEESEGKIQRERDRGEETEGKRQRGRDRGEETEGKRQKGQM
jgi:hypothetical protein